MLTSFQKFLLKKIKKKSKFRYFKKVGKNSINLLFTLRKQRNEEAYHEWLCIFTSFSFEALFCWNDPSWIALISIKSSNTSDKRLLEYKHFWAVKVQASS